MDEKNLSKTIKNLRQKISRRQKKYDALKAAKQKVGEIRKEIQSLNKDLKQLLKAREKEKKNAAKEREKAAVKKEAAKVKERLERKKKNLRQSTKPIVNPFTEKESLITSLKSGGANKMDANELRQNISHLAPILQARLNEIIKNGGVPAYYFLEYPNAGDNVETYLKEKYTDSQLNKWGRPRLLLELTKLVNTLSAPSLTIEGAKSIADKQDEMIKKITGTDTTMSYEERTAFWKAFDEFRRQYPALINEHGSGTTIAEFFRYYTQEFKSQNFEINADKFTKIKNILESNIDAENERTFMPNVYSGRGDD